MDFFPELEQAAESSTHADVTADEPADDAAADASGLDLPSASDSKTMTTAERKTKQRAANRVAAERSRNRKREELTALEMTVSNIQEENAQLRQRLSSLVGPKASALTAPPTTAEVVSKPITIDFAALAKLQAELATAKAALLDKETELARVRSGHAGATAADSETDALRTVLASHNATLDTLRAEAKTLHALVAHLKGERDGLARQREVLSRELDARRQLLEGAAGGAAADGQGVAGAERALLELRGFLDSAIKNWDHTSLLPGEGLASR